jgi:hypothetical protein
MRPQLPSLGDAVTAAQRTLARFPTVILASAVSATAMILLVDEVGPEALQLRLLATATLALPLLVALTLFAERPERRRGALLALRLAGAAALAGFYLAWPHWSEPVRAGRYWQLSVAFHLLVAFLPFLGQPLANAFWQMNRALFTRFLAAATSSGTLWVGLSLALLAVNKLFGVDVPGTGDMRLWAVIAVVFNTWFFLGGVPDDPDALEERRDYPAVLRVFAQYTLVPLVSVYLVILTLYLGKVVVTWDWPSGWIGWLVSGVAGAGILALLLVHPAADQPEQHWIATFARQFWLAIIPSIVMLWLALYQRVDQYGITERRYFLILLSLWLAALAVYYSVTRSRNIRIVPASLCVVALLTLAGPWSAYAVSEGSQVRRLRGLLERSGAFADGKVRRATREPGTTDAKEISAIVRYLVETHGTTAIAGWFADSLAARIGMGSGAVMGPAADRRAEQIVASLGIAYVAGRGARGLAAGEYSYTAAAGSVVPLGGYDWLVPIRTAKGSVPPDTGLAALAVPAARTVRLFRAGEPLLDVPLDSALARLRAAMGARRSGRVPQALLRAEAGNARARAAVYLLNVAGADSAGIVTVSGLSGDVLVKLRP